MTDRVSGMFRAAPVVWVADIEACILFYRDRLGFRCTHTDSANGRAHYAVLARDGAEVHLSAAHVERAGSSTYHLLVRDVDALHREFVGHGVDVTGPPTDTTYGMRAFFFRDCEQNVVEVGMLQPGK